MSKNLQQEQKTVVVFLVTGQKMAYYLQAHFSLVSFQSKHPECDYLVITDHPHYFKAQHLGENVLIKELEPGTIQTWSGKHEYFFRSKIKCMQLAHDLFPTSSLVLIDSDTVLVNSFELHFKNLANQQDCLFHCSEGPMRDRRGKTSRAIWRHLQNKTYLQIPVPDTYCLMNSGVLGFPHSKIGKTLADTLEINDILLDEAMPGFTHEQIAFNIAAIGSYRNLRTCESDLLHYWGNKEEWLEFIKGFFLECYLESKNPLDVFDRYTEKALRTLPIIKQRKTLARRVIRFSENISLKKEIFF